MPDVRDKVQLWWFMNREWVLRTLRAVAVVLVVASVLGVGCALAGFRLPLVACGHLLRGPCPACPGLEAADSARAAGRYSEVESLTKSALEANPKLECWQELQAQFDENPSRDATRDLDVGFRLEYLPGRRPTPKLSPSGVLRLSTLDRYYVTVKPSERAYLYLFQIDGANNLTAIFPNAGTTMSKNPLPPDEQRIPGLTKYLSVSPQRGQERLYLIAAAWEIPELEQIAKEAAAAKGGARQKLASRFLARAKNEKQYAPPLPGLAYQQWDIESLGTPASESAKKE